MHHLHWLPVSRLSTPTFRVLRLRHLVHRVSLRQDRRIQAAMTLRRGDKLYRAVAVFSVVPVDQNRNPPAGLGHICKRLRRKLRTVFQRLE